MIARLLLMLLLAGLALPAMAAAPCHGGGVDMVGMAMPYSMPAPATEHDRQAVAVHACLGYIPPAMFIRAAVAAPAPRIAVRRRLMVVAFNPGRTGPPATPPPRLGT